MKQHPNPVWLKSSNQRQSELFKRMKELHRTNLHFKNALDVLEASLDIMEAVMKVRSQEEDLRFKYNDVTMFRFDYQKSWISHFSTWLSPEEFTRFRRWLPDKRGDTEQTTKLCERIRDFELDMLKREVEEANRKKQKRKHVKPAEKPDPYASGALEKAIDELG
jgi:hypothetical protein